MAGHDSFMPGGAGRDAARLFGAAVRNRRRRTAYDDVLWGTARTYFLSVLLAVSLLWGIAFTTSALWAFDGGSAETEHHGYLGLALLVAGVAPATGVVVLLRRRPGQWWIAAGAAVATALAMLASGVLQG
jgi:hypothetical protein